MIRANFGTQPESQRTNPNGLYEAYRNLLDEIFYEEAFDNELLKHLYVYDRFEYTKERLMPRHWRRVQLVDDLLLKEHFDLRSEFGVYEKEILSILTVNTHGKLIRVIGGAGTGKSTFLKFMFGLYLPNQVYFKDGFIVVANLLEELRLKGEYEYDDAADILVRRIIEGVRSSGSPGSELFLADGPSLAQYLKSRVHASAPNRVVIVLDNGDQFPASFQEHMCSFATSLAKATECTVVLAVRDVNARHFSDPSTIGDFARYDFFQRAPLIHKVIQNRLRYLVRNKPGFDKPRLLRIETKQFAISLSEVTGFAENFIRIILNEKVRDALDNLTNQNVRVALIWALDLLRSSHLDVPRMLGRLIYRSESSETDRGLDELDTLVFSLGLCNHAMYFSSVSRLENIFSAGLQNEHDLLISFRCLKYCAQADLMITKSGLIEHMGRFGYDHSETARTVDRLLQSPRRLLESMDGNSFESLQTLNTSLAGNYYLNRLIYNMNYLRIVSDDVLLPEDISVNRGSWWSRTRNLIRFLEFVGKRELEELRLFLETEGNRDSLTRGYLKIYGKTPMAAQILNSLRALLQGRLDHSTSPDDRTEVLDLLADLESTRETLITSSSKNLSVIAK